MKTGNRSGSVGGSVPLEGESEIHQVSTGVDVLTITMASGASSTTAGRALVVRAFDGTEFFSVDYGGVVSVGASAAMAIPVKPTVIVGAGDSYTVLAANAGKLHIYSGPTTGAGLITLPASSGLAVGTNYEFLFTAAAISSGTRVSSSLSSSDDILFQNPATIVASTGKVMRVTSTGLQLGSALRLTTITGKRWWAESLSVTSTIGGWAVVAA